MRCRTTTTSVVRRRRGNGAGTTAVPPQNEREREWHSHREPRVHWTQCGHRARAGVAQHTDDGQDQRGSDASTTGPAGPEPATPERHRYGRRHRQRSGANAGLDARGRPKGHRNLEGDAGSIWTAAPGTNGICRCGTPAGIQERTTQSWRRGRTRRRQSRGQSRGKECGGKS